MLAKDLEHISNEEASKYFSDRQAKRSSKKELDTMCHCLAYQPPLIFVNVLERARALYRNAVRSGNKARIYTTDHHLKQTTRVLYNLAWQEARKGNLDSSQPYYEEMRRTLRSRLFTFTGLKYMGQSNDSYSYEWKRKGMSIVVKPGGIYLYWQGGKLLDGAAIAREHHLGLFREIANIKTFLEGILPDVPYARPRYAYDIVAPRYR